MSEWIEVTGRITVDIVLAPKEARMPYDLEAFVADLYDQWNQTSDYIPGDDRNGVTFRGSVQKIKDIPDEE